jgi:hypothetical protein
VRDFERQIPETTSSAGMWLVLSILSLFAGYGFLSQINEQYEAMRLKDSDIYAQAKQEVQDAQQKLND